MTEVLKAYKNRVLNYDRDLLNQSVLIQIRIYQAQLPATPTPPSLEFRLSDEPVWKVPKRIGWEPRNVSACFASDTNQSGESRRTVVNPYRPGDSQHKQLIKEVFAWPDVLALDYTGETLNKKYEDFV
jgi:hypothetical protein